MSINQSINKINISETQTNYNNQIDTTGRINDKLKIKFNKNDIIKKDNNQSILNDDKVYSAAKIDYIFETNRFQYIDNIEMECIIKLYNYSNTDPSEPETDPTTAISEYYYYKLIKPGLITEYSVNNNHYINLNIFDFYISLSEMELYNDELYTNHYVLYDDTITTPTNITIINDTKTINPINISSYIKNNDTTQKIVYANIFIKNINIKNNSYNFKTYTPINSITPEYKSTLSDKEPIRAGLKSTSLTISSLIYTNILQFYLNRDFNYSENNNNLELSGIICFYNHSSDIYKIKTSYFSLNNVVFEKIEN